MRRQVLRWILLAVSLLPFSPIALRAQVQSVIFVQKFRPPAIYTQWYREVEQCAGVTGRHRNMQRIRWFVTPLPWRGSDTTGWTHGQWQAYADSHGRPNPVTRIVVNRLQVLDPNLVKHEMLHDILWRHGWVPEGPIPAVTGTRADSVIVRITHPSPPYEKCAPTYQNPYNPVTQSLQPNSAK